MRSLLKLTLFGICLLACAPPAAYAQGKGQPDPLKKRFQGASLFPIYDEAKDETGVYMWALGLTPPTDAVGSSITAAALVPVEGVRFTVFFTYPGRTYAPPRQVTLRLVSTKRSEPWFTAGAEVAHALLADGERLGVGRSPVTSRKYQADIPKPGTEYVEQTLELPLTVEEFGRLAASKKAEVVIGGKSTPLKGMHLKALRRVADAIAPSQ
jgi:hypothetical protein